MVLMSGHYDQASTREKQRTRVYTHTVADAVDERAHALVVQVALARAVDRRLLRVHLQLPSQASAAVVANSSSAGSLHLCLLCTSHTRLAH